MRRETRLFDFFFFFVRRLKIQVVRGAFVLFLIENHSESPRE